MSAQSERAERPFRIFVLVAACVAIVCVHLPLIGYATYANVDEAYSMSLAQRLLDGHKLYVGAISQRGPLMYYAFTALAWLHGWDNVVAVRVWALAFSLAQVLTVYWAGRKLLTPHAATIAAGIMGYALAFGFPPPDGIALHGEHIQAPVLLVGVVLGATAMRRAPLSRARVLQLAAAGLAFGVAFAIKQSVALHPLPLVLWALVDARRRRTGTRAWVADVAALFGAMSLVPLVLVAHSALSGTLDELLYYTVKYNRDVHLKPTSKRFAWLTPFFLSFATNTLFASASVAAFAFGIPRLVRRVRAAVRLRSPAALGRGFGARVYLGLNLGLAIFAASAMYRFFPHYYVQAVPFLALCLGASLERPFRRAATAWPSRVVAGALMFFVMFAGALGCVFGERVDGRVGHDRTAQVVSRYIEATTAPTDRIFVWGFSSWVYPYAHRRPAGRYVFGTYVTGFVPWYWEDLDVEKARIVPGSVEALLGDLEREAPAIIVDAGSIMMARPMRTYEKPAAFLRASYCFEARVGAFDVYRRKPNGGRCALPYFPRPHPAVDWNGRGTGVPMPKTVDYEYSPRLPPGDYFKPIWFLEGPKPPERGLEATRDPKAEKEEKEGAAKGFVIVGIEPYGPPPTDVPLEGAREPGAPPGISEAHERGREHDHDPTRPPSSP
jgi:4-amino-4-deoxy-L-arabinose transferase-like glycosyltransferase